MPQNSLKFRLVQKSCPIVPFLLLGMVAAVGCNANHETTTNLETQTTTDASSPSPADSEMVSPTNSETPPLTQKTDPSQKKKIGVLLISHGSHSQGWRKMVSSIGDTVQKEVLHDGKIAGIRSAFMEYTGPSIATQLKQFDNEDYTDILLIPLLLTVSSHSFDDIPTICGQKQDRKTLETLRLEGIEVYKPKANVHIAPLLNYPTVLEKNVIRRAKQMSKNPDNEGIVLVAYGSKPYEEAWVEMIEEIGKKVRNELNVNCTEYAWCGHIVHYKSDPTEKAIRRVLEQKERALVIPILVAVDENFQGKIIGGAVKNVHAKERIEYRHDAILPDENINQWIIDISHQTAEKLTQSP